jgi:hypothetical protein
MSLPTTGREIADTNIKAVKPKVRVDRLQPRSSDIGLSTSPKANLEPVPKKSTKKPEARITQL